MHTKLRREIFPFEMSVSTNPANVGLYRFGFRDDLSEGEKREKEIRVSEIKYV